MTTKPVQTLIPVEEETKEQVNREEMDEKVVLTSVVSLPSLPSVSGRRIVIASRKSKLALIQTYWVRDRLSASFPNYEFVIQEHDTIGDSTLNVALSKIGDKGLFTQELEESLLTGRADFAVHSLKDVPTQLPAGLTLGAITERESPLDVVVGKPLKDAKVVGTSSLRRQAQLASWYPGKFQFVDIRGNLDTRLRKLDQGDCDVIILAEAGLKRQGYENRITERLENMYYAVGQGALGIECRENDEVIQHMLKQIHHERTAMCCTAERGLMERLKGGCHAPIGVRTEMVNNSDTNNSDTNNSDTNNSDTNNSDTLILHGCVLSLDGKQIISDSVSASISSTTVIEIGYQLADKLLEQGADIILQEITNKK